MPLSRHRFLALGAAGAVTLATRPSVAARRVAGGWQAAAPLPWSTREMCCTTWNEQIVVAGGLAGAALGGTLYVFGGEYFSDDGGVYEHTWAYDPDPDTRAKRAPMQLPRHGLAGAALGGRVYVIGGNTAADIAAATLSVVETYTSSEN